jgi:GxxExxY protein
VFRNKAVSRSDAATQRETKLISRSGAAMQRKIFSNMHENEIGTKVLDAAFEIHRELGPGLLESVYEAVLVREIEARGLQVKRQVPIPIRYKGISIEEGFRADLLVEDKVIVELKSVEKVIPAHKKQVQTYLKLAGCKLGYVMNFGEALLKDGITRCVNGLAE